VVQAVDPTSGRDVPDGQWGNLVVTTLDRDNGVLRYDVEEACALVREPCTCGETTIRGFWGGRFKDLLSCQGKRFQAAELEAALRGVPAVREPSLEWAVVRPQRDDAPLIVRVEQGSGNAADAAQACVGAVMEKLGIVAQVEVLARGTLARSGYKTNRIVDA